MRISRCRSFCHHRTDVPVELDLEQLRLKEPDANKMQEIFAELEFKKLRLEGA